MPLLLLAVALAAPGPARGLEVRGRVDARGALGPHVPHGRTGRRADAPAARRRQAAGRVEVRVGRRRAGRPAAARRRLARRDDQRSGSTPTGTAGSPRPSGTPWPTSRSEAKITIPFGDGGQAGRNGARPQARRGRGVGGPRVHDRDRDDRREAGRRDAHRRRRGWVLRRGRARTASGSTSTATASSTRSPSSSRSAPRSPAGGTAAAGAPAGGRAGRTGPRAAERNGHAPGRDPAAAEGRGGRAERELRQRVRRTGRGEGRRQAAGAAGREVPRRFGSASSSPTWTARCGGTRSLRGTARTTSRSRRGRKRFTGSSTG